MNRNRSDSEIPPFVRNGLKMFARRDRIDVSA